MVVQETLSYLNQGKIILYPTDTVWGVGGDATRADVVQRIYELKKRDDAKALIGLVGSKDKLEQYVGPIPKEIEPYLESDRPTTVIYSNPKGLAKNMFSNEQTIALRIPKNPFLEELLDAFGKAIISTSANLSRFSTPKKFNEVSQEILDGVDYIVPLMQEKNCGNPSRIIKLENKNSITILRP
nr:translation factor Sua5 [uncultured bacterium]